MAGRKHLVLFLTEISLLCVVVLSVGNENEQRIDIIQELSSRFQQFRMHSQYAVLYMLPPNNPLTPDYIPKTPPSSFTFTNRNRPIMYPTLPAISLPDEFQYNYVAAIPDFRGRTYGHALGRTGTSTIHTEDLFLSLVFRRMLAWYRDYYGQDPPAVYMYTYFIPCPDCTSIIQNAVTNIIRDTNNNPIPLYVGFSKLLGGVRNENRNEAIRRRNTLQNILNNYGGRLYDIGRTLARAGVAICPLEGFSRRQKRQAYTNGECSEDEFLFMRMDFNTGKAQVDWYQPNVARNENAWVGLYDKNGNRKTYEYLKLETSGIKTFDYYISDGLEVRLSDSDRENIVRTSYPWNNCGFGWRKMNNLPGSYGNVYMALTIKDGYPKVEIAFCNRRNVTNSLDYVGLQSMDQAFSDTKQDYQEISKLSYVASNIYQYTYGRRLSMSEGFRVKYVYSTGLSYHYEDLYDNASPFWTPGGCTGVEATTENSYNKDPCNAGSPMQKESFALAVTAVLCVLMNSG